MKILKVIHGYPMRYNAGSEVYTQMLCHSLAIHHEVHVFTREEDPFLADYTIHVEEDADEPRVKLHIINLLGDRHRYRYCHTELDIKFAELLDELIPDVVHVGHLNHLSTSLIYEIKKRKIPLIFTLHDYWLMCPRGQFIQRNSQSLWAICSEQNDLKCATNCYAGCSSGAPSELAQDIAYWQNWVARRMQHIRDITSLVDCFIAPSRYLYSRFIEDFSLPENKMLYLDYGFDLQRFAKPRVRQAKGTFIFGYIGTHIPSKGIQHLIEAFSLLNGSCILRIWGKPNQNTTVLKTMARTLNVSREKHIEWLGEYQNSHIMNDVFNKVDCIVVPSIWVENSPLVIHESLQAQVPVITADAGGMEEYIKHEKNGFLFQHRNVKNLAATMQIVLDDPLRAAKIGANGYLQSEDGNIPNMQEHTKQIEDIYHQLLQNKKDNIHAI